MLLDGGVKMTRFSNYWKDNQSDQFATDYPFFKKLQQQHQQELLDMKNYYQQEIENREKIIEKLNRRVSELTSELEDQDGKRVI